MYYKYIIKMESNDQLKEIDIKNRACYYFDDIIKIEDFDPDNFLLGEISYKKMQFKTFHTKIWLLLNICILFAYGFIRVDGTRYLVLFLRK